MYIKNENFYKFLKDLIIFIPVKRFLILSGKLINGGNIIVPLLQLLQHAVNSEPTASPEKLNESQ
jgi:hypothetical protein